MYIGLPEQTNTNGTGAVAVVVVGAAVVVVVEANVVVVVDGWPEVVVEELADLDGVDELEPRVNPMARPMPSAARTAAAMPARTTVLRRMWIMGGSSSVTLQR